MRVPIVDQFGQYVGTDCAPDMLVEAFTDVDGVVWTPPSAEAYYRACRARDAWADRARIAQRHLAALVDAARGSDELEYAEAMTTAKGFLHSKMGIEP